MCECGCGDIRADYIFTPADSASTVAIDVYPGCRECEPVVGIDIRLFNRKGVKDFLDGNYGKRVAGDEYGCLPTLKSIPIISIDSLLKAARELEFHEGSEVFLLSFLEDDGLNLLQRAIAIELAAWSAREAQAKPS